MFFGSFDCDYTLDLPHLWRWVERFVDKQGEFSGHSKELGPKSFPNTRIRAKSKEVNWHKKIGSGEKKQRR